MPIINQAQIAGILNVSRATVSKALKDADDISDGMKKRVRDLAEKFNYIPHYHASNLQSKRTRTIGIVVPDISYSFFAFAIDGIMDAAQRSGYQVILTVSREKADIERKNILTLLSMRVDGLLVAVSRETRNIQIFRKVRRSEIPLVFFDRSIEGLGFSAVGIDDRDAARRLIDFVLRSGYRRIWHIAGSSGIDVGRNRRAGYEDALKKRGIRLRKDWITEGGFTRADGRRGFRELHRRGSLPDVIFAANDQIALGAYDAMRELGIRYPDRVGVVAFSHHEYAEIVSPSLTIIHVDPCLLGRKAMELLLRHMDHPGARSRRLRIPAEIQKGESIRIPGIRREKINRSS
ncbi:LacI family DNA-binding transcriptional regulator [bacterium]|nr:LacI family DNA-binding transcriptional regulator [bacterium]